MVRNLIYIAILMGVSISSSAQSPKQLIREGYDLFQDGKFVEAAEKFKAAGVDDPNTFRPYFNEGGAWYEADSLELAAQQFETAQYRAEDKEGRAAALHNLGNTYLKKEEYDKSIEYFKQALLQNPQDEETRYNLAYAMAKKQEEQGQQQNQEQENEEDQQEQEQEKQQNQEQEQKKEQQEQQNQQQQQQKQEISEQQAEQLLKALEKEEQDLQKKMLQIEGQPEKREKDW